MEPASHAGNSKRFAVALPASNARLDALVCAMAGGDQTALSNLYQQTAPQVFSIARRLLRNQEDAEEIVCDVYTFAWRHSQAYDSTRGSVMAWLSVMTRNRAVDRLRQRRDNISLDDERHQALSTSLHAETPTPEQMLAEFQAGSAVHQALSALSEKRRQLIGLAFFQGLTHEEIAAVVGMPLGTVKSHLRRALAVLQGELSAQP
jgi:RNA polymerase sigma factor (sigma-70 family)